MLPRPCFLELVPTIKISQNHLDGNELSAHYALSNADALLMAESSFSVTAALLQRGPVFRPASVLYHGKAPGWITVFDRKGKALPFACASRTSASWDASSVVSSDEGEAALGCARLRDVLQHTQPQGTDV